MPVAFQAWADGADGVKKADWDFNCHQEKFLTD
jgi:hypothetical protein